MRARNLERVTRIELVLRGWEPHVLPLDDTRKSRPPFTTLTSVQLLGGLRRLKAGGLRPATENLVDARRIELPHARCKRASPPWYMRAQMFLGFGHPISAPVCRSLGMTIRTKQSKIFDTIICLDTIDVIELKD